MYSSPYVIGKDRILSTESRLDPPSFTRKDYFISGNANLLSKIGHCWEITTSRHLVVISTPHAITPPFILLNLLRLVRPIIKLFFISLHFAPKPNEYEYLQEVAVPGQRIMFYFIQEVYTTDGAGCVSERGDATLPRARHVVPGIALTPPPTEIAFAYTGPNFTLDTWITSSGGENI